MGLPTLPETENGITSRSRDNRTPSQNTGTSPDTDIEKTDKANRRSPHGTSEISQED